MEKRDNIAFRHIEHFDQITRPNATGKGDSITNLTNPIALEDLIPDNPSNFYRYNGSLTTPLCNEAVIWTVFDTPIALSERQVTIQMHKIHFQNVFLFVWFFVLDGGIQAAI